jgi:sulfite oxidase
MAWRTFRSKTLRGVALAGPLAAGASVVSLPTASSAEENKDLLSRLKFRAGAAPPPVEAREKGLLDRMPWSNLGGTSGHDVAWGSGKPDERFVGLPQPTKPKEKLPTMTIKEVKGDHGDQIWVTYKGGVYNVTPFLDAHPGGPARIEMVNGGDLEAYWKVYELHNRPHIQALMQEFRIGNLTDADAKKMQCESVFADSYHADPVRPKVKGPDPAMRMVTRAPFNAEPRMPKLMEKFYTPNDIFFVRNHNPVPEIDVKDWKLEVEANPDIGVKSVSFSLKDLKTKFEKVEVVAALQCAGNRQEDYVTPDRPLYVAPHWRNGAIGNAKWGGVRVRDLLGAAGLPVDAMALGKVHLPDAQIVNFQGADMDETGTPYAAVVPVAKCIDPFGDTILAYEMNGEELPMDHGYPIRCLAPGTGGCRNCKWVTNISVSAKPSELDSGSKLDRHFCPAISWTGHREHAGQDRVPEYQALQDGIPVNVEHGPVIQSLPVQSVLAWPPADCTLSGKDTTVRVEGVAYAGGGRGIARVEVSINGGTDFYPASLRRHQDSKTPPAEFGVGRNWGWVQFQEDVPIDPETLVKLKAGEKVEIEVCSKAIDGDFNSQPEQMRTTWNVLGICVNHWPRNKVTLDPTLPAKYMPKPKEDPPPGAYWRE